MPIRRPETSEFPQDISYTFSEASGAYTVKHLPPEARSSSSTSSTARGRTTRRSTTTT